MRFYSGDGIIIKTTFTKWGADMSETNSLSSSDVRAINRNRVFKFIYTSDKPVTKQDIGYALSMSLPTLTQNLTELLEQGVIDDSAVADSSSGRKPKLYSAVPEARCAIGVELSRGHIRLVAADLGGREMGYRQVAEPFALNASYRDALHSELSAFIEELGIDRERILGIGFTVPGTVDADRFVIASAPTLGIVNADLSGLLEGVGFPVNLINDADAGGYAESRINPGEEAMAYFSIGRGVGGAILLNGRNYSGLNRRSAEFGHICIHPGGAQCDCGRKGCLEAYCSTAKLSEELFCDIDAFFAGVDRKDAFKKAVWNTYLDNLALGIHNVHMMLDADIVLGGKLAKHLGERLEELESRLARLNNETALSYSVRVSAYHEKANAMGAALRFIDGFISAV